MPSPLQGDVYLIAADDDPDNRFPRVEAMLRESLGLPGRRFPLVPLPQVILATLLRLRGRSETNLRRAYSSDRLQKTGFTSTESVASAVRSFGLSLASVDPRTGPQRDTGKG